MQHEQARGMTVRLCASERARIPYERCTDPVRGTGNYQLSKQTDGIKESDWQFSERLFWSAELESAGVREEDYLTSHVSASA